MKKISSHFEKVVCSSNSQAWKFLLAARDKAENNIIWQINVYDCSFWCDNWSTRELFPEFTVQQKSAIIAFLLILFGISLQLGT
ncbi:hypothetical protein P3S68_025743 [Capsicum galapagoense]